MRLPHPTRRLARLRPALATALLGLSLGVASPAWSAEDAQASLRALFKEAQEKQKGVTVYLHGQAVGLAVVEVRDDVVIGRSREFGRIVLRLERIDGAALN